MKDESRPYGYPASIHPSSFILHPSSFIILEDTRGCERGIEKKDRPPNPLGGRSVRRGLLLPCRSASQPAAVLAAGLLAELRIPTAPLVSPSRRRPVPPTPTESLVAYRGPSVARVDAVGSRSPHVVFLGAHRVPGMKLSLTSSSVAV